MRSPNRESSFSVAPTVLPSFMVGNGVGYAGGGSGMHSRASPPRNAAADHKNNSGGTDTKRSTGNQKLDNLHSIYSQYGMPPPRMRR